MKKLNFFTLLLCLFTIVVVTESCSKDDTCPTKECNTGTLNDDTCDCDCPAGFEGTDCSTLWNAKFVGDYMMESTCSGIYMYGPWPANISVNPTDDSSIILFYDFGSGTRTINATLLTSTTFDIPEQNIGDTSNGSGNGSIDQDGVVTVNWTNSGNGVICVWTIAQ